MLYNILGLQTDVMALSGENPRRRESLSAVGAPWAQDMIAMRIKALLPSCGRNILLEAPPHLLGGGETITPGFSCKMMPCGLYAVDLQLPATTLRIASLKLPGWKREVSRVIPRDSAEWERQWSPESGIAGCPAKPMAYMDASESGMLLRAIGTDRPFAAETAPAPAVGICRVPEPDEDDNFHFPETLYPQLVLAISQTN